MMTLRTLLCTLLLLTASVAAPAGPDAQAFKPLRIAHAGGALGKKTYTNSYQALDANLALGFRYFEIDFLFTSDRHLVCLHDWQDNFRRTFRQTTDAPLSLAQFNTLVANNRRFTNCTLDGLAQWMTNNPEALVVTDVRADNLEALRMVMATLPDAGQRVIPQVYQPRNFAKVREMGYQQIIWTLYRYQGSSWDVIQWAEKLPGPFAIAMPRAQAKTALPAALAARGVITYAHTINSASEWDLLRAEHGINEIYTDFLAPETP